MAWVGRDYVEHRILGFSVLRTGIVYDCQRGLPLSYDDAVAIAEKLLDYIQLGRDVIDSRLSEAQHQEEEIAAQSRNSLVPLSRPGFVYLIRAGDLCKIGMTISVESRLSSLQSSSSLPIELLHVIETTDMDTTETALHEKFQNKRVNGEWFNLSLEDIEYIKGRRS